MINQYSWRIVFSFFLLFLFANSALFLLRCYDSVWWAFDYQVYHNVEFDLHLKAFLSFLFYYCFIFLCIYFFYPRFAIDYSAGQRDLGCLLLVFLLLAQTLAAVFLKVGVAGGTGESPVFLYFLFIFSIDFFYLYYVLHERRRSYIYGITLLYVLSNLVRGWAGFVFFLFVAFWIRKRNFKFRYFFYLSPLLFFLLMILLHVRDVFRGGFSPLDKLIEDGYSGMELVLEYIQVIFVNILTRFDMYSHYIGVSWMEGLPDNACMPIQENIFYKIYTKIFQSDQCVSLGSLLPGYLYDFFRGKGTSYSVGSGFFSLPSDVFWVYALSIFLTLIFSLVFIRFFLRTHASLSLAAILILFIFSQGWVYQFVYMLSGILVASIYYRLKF